MEKLENMMKEEFSFEKEGFHLFKSLLYKNGKAQNFPVMAGRLVNDSVKLMDYSSICNAYCQRRKTKKYLSNTILDRR